MQPGLSPRSVFPDSGVCPVLINTSSLCCCHDLGVCDFSWACFLPLLPAFSSFLTFHILVPCHLSVLWKQLKKVWQRASQPWSLSCGRQSYGEGDHRVSCFWATCHWDVSWLALADGNLCKGLLEAVMCRGKEMGAVSYVSCWWREEICFFVCVFPNILIYGGSSAESCSWIWVQGMEEAPACIWEAELSSELCRGDVGFRTWIPWAILSCSSSSNGIFCSRLEWL